MGSVLTFVQAWGLPLLGIFIAVGIFLYQNRQKIGAETERRLRANQEMTELLERRLVLENYYPSAKELTKIRDGLATKHNVDPDDLISDEALENSIFFNVLANDYIEPSKRLEILDKIRTPKNSTREQSRTFFLKSSDTDSDSADGAASSSQVLSYVGNAAASIGASIAIVVGVGEAFLPNFETTLGGVVSRTVENLVIPITVGSVLITAAVAYFTYQRTRETRLALDRVSQRSELSSIQLLEVTIRQQLHEAIADQKLKSIEEFSAPIQCDFMVELNDHSKIAVEIKSLRRPTINSIKRWDATMARALQQTDARRGVIVLPDDAVIPPLDSILMHSNIEIMTLSAFLRLIGKGA
jgi:hypothetical protein